MTTVSVRAKIGLRFVGDAIVRDFVGAILTAGMLVMAVVAVTSQSAWAGGSPDELADQELPSKALVGFVKDTSGNIVADAKVVASYKSGNTELVTRSDATGHYRIPGFSKDADADSVVLSCSKGGYRQKESLKRRSTITGQSVPIEVDCVLAKE
jgi:hypothetical protein